MATIDSRSALNARTARFKREEQRPPPPLPTNRITVSEGKVVTSDKDFALRKLLERKASAGVPLTADQQRVLSNLGASSNQMKPLTNQLKTVRPAVSTSQPKKAAGGGGKSQPKQATTINDFLRKKDPDPKDARKLRQKIRDCEALESAAAAGTILEANQRRKMEGKAAPVEQLERLVVA